MGYDYGFHSYELYNVKLDVLGVSENQVPQILMALRDHEKSDVRHAAMPFGLFSVDSCVP